VLVCFEVYVSLILTVNQSYNISSEMWGWKTSNV